MDSKTPANKIGTETTGISNEINVLVVNESSTLEIQIQEELEKSEMEVFAVYQTQSISSAKQLLRENSYDVVLLNAEKTGPEIVKLVNNFKEFLETTAFVLLMPKSNEPLARHLLMIGIQDYFLKDESSVDSLGRSIRQSFSQIKARSVEKKRAKKLNSLYVDKLEAESSLLEKTVALEKRIRELDCLYAVSFFMDDESMSIDQILKKTVDMVPLAWLHFQDACACIVIDGQEYVTSNYAKTRWVQESTIYSRKQPIGSVRVYYLEEKPDEHEGPFLKEEKDLLDNLSLRIGRFVTRRRMEEELKEAHNKLSIRFHQQEASLTDVRTQLQKEKSDHELVAVELDESRKIADKHARKMEKILDLQAKILNSDIFGVIFFENHTIDWFNERIKTMFRFNDLELADKKLGSLFPSQEDYESYLELAGKELEKSGYYSGEWLLRLNNGSLAWFSLQEKTIQKTDHMHESFWIVTNISQQKIEAEKRKQTEFMVNTSKSLMCMFDRNYRLVSYNKAYARAQNRFPEELIRFELSRLFKMGDFEQRVKPVLEDCFSGNTMTSDTIHVHNMTGTRRFQTTYYPYRDKSTITHIVAVSTDVTAMKKSEDALIVAKERAEEMNRLKSNFLNVVSHELRTPLTVILANTPLLTDEEQMPPPDDIVEISVDIEDSARHLLDLVNDLLDFSKIEAGKMQLTFSRIDSEKIISDIVNNVLKLADEKGLKLKQYIEPFTFEADPLRFKQILLNIISNAVKFTDEGSITVNARQKNEMAHFEIIDTGCGIKEKDLPVIFDVFRQLDHSLTRSAGGTGLGLAITQKLVAQHKGEIFVDSVYGEGSRFTITMPLQQQQGSVPDETG